MKKIPLLAALIAASTVAPVTAQETHRPRYNVGMVQTSNLPHTEFNHSPLRLNIVNEDPIITSTPYEPPQKRYIIQLSPNSQGSDSVTSDIPGAQKVGDGLYVIGPSSSPGRHVNPMIGPLNNLAHPGFETNIPAGGMLPRQILPNGMTTNRLSGTYRPTAQAQPSAGGSLPAIAHGSVPASATLQQQPTTRSYPATGSVGTSSGGLQARTNVKAVLKTLLDKTH